MQRVYWTLEVLPHIASSSMCTSTKLLKEAIIIKLEVCAITAKFPGWKIRYVPQTNLRSDHLDEKNLKSVSEHVHGLSSAPGKTLRKNHISERTFFSV